QPPMADDRPILDPGQPRVHPDEYPAAGLGEFQPPGAPSESIDPERDQRLATEISTRLRENPMVDETRIDIQVFNGEVTLLGVADNRFVKHRAEELTSEVQGVTKILNK